jgi:hypothetical protein
MERIDVGYGAQERFLLEIVRAVDVAGLRDTAHQTLQLLRFTAICLTSVLAG